ncbi:MAG: hypothetical protein ACRDT4_04105 [Micromonosporaceae bacterium]
MAVRKSRASGDAKASNAGSVTVAEVGSALLLRAAGDPAGLTSMTRRLPWEEGRVTIVSAPSITARQDLFDLVATVADEWIPDRTVGVRLVTIGTVPAPALVEAGLRAVADRTGRSFAAPLGTVLVGEDGTMAASGGPGALGGWLVCTPGGAPHREPAWYPAPTWGDAVPAGSAVMKRHGAVATHPVPAGYWILPGDVRPGSAGAAACLAPDRHTPTVLLGGSGRPPLPLEELLRAIAGLPLRRVRIVLLPGALPSGRAVAQLRGSCGPQTQICAGVPVWSDDRKWKLAPVGATGRLIWRPPASSRWAAAFDRFRAAGPGTGATRRVRREPSRRRRPEVGVATRAGWSFRTGKTPPVGLVPAAAGFVVEVDVDTSGFLMGGHRVSPETLGRMIADCGELGRAPVIVIGHGDPPADPDAVFGALCDTLRRPVIAADANVSMSQTGLLRTSGRFYTWRPAAGPARGPGRHWSRASAPGGTLPPYATAPPTGYDPEPPATSGEPPDPSGDAARAAGARRSPRRPRAGEPSSGWARADHTSGFVAAQTDRAGGAHGPVEADEERLRQVLAGSYETYAGVAAAALGDPGDRQSVCAGLVAVRAYCVAEREAVNRALRGAGAPPSYDTPAALLATYAAAGLRRLPAVFGPVFAATGVQVPQGTYQPGDELVEPGFLDVDLLPGSHPDTIVEFLIWSLTARRLGELSTGVPGTALFAPGSRFRVLDVDAGPRHMRVLLVDLGGGPLAGDARGTVPAELVRRMRQSVVRPNATAGQLSRLLDSPIGLIECR